MKALDEELAKCNVFRQAYHLGQVTGASKFFENLP